MGFAASEAVNESEEVEETDALKILYLFFVLKRPRARFLTNSRFLSVLIYILGL
jgi:hypothetical protein